jgi:hypothetical protein
MTGSTRNLDRDKITTNKSTDGFTTTFFNAAYQLGVTIYWLEMRIGALIQNGFKTFAALHGFDFR